MILKKKKAVIAAILSAALTASAVMPTVSAGTRTKEESVRRFNLRSEFHVRCMMTLLQTVRKRLSEF